MLTYARGSICVSLRFGQWATPWQVSSCMLESEGGPSAEVLFLPSTLNPTLNPDPQMLNPKP